VAGLDGSHLFVQGPPGSGKTYNGAQLICHLLGRGARVGVASSSHAAIHNLLTEVERFAGEAPPSGAGRRRGRPQVVALRDRGAARFKLTHYRLSEPVGEPESGKLSRSGLERYPRGA